MADLNVPITVTIPSVIKDNAILAICNNKNYQDNVLDGNGDSIPNPESKALFSKRMAGEMTSLWVKNIYIAYMAEQSRDSAHATASTDADGITVA